MPVKELHNHPGEVGSSDQSLLLMVLGYGELFTRVKMVYYSPFQLEASSLRHSEPRVAFVACDLATSDINFFNWWRERDYYLLETMRLVWKNPENDKLWLSRNIAIFKRKRVFSI